MLLLVVGISKTRIFSPCRVDPVSERRQNNLTQFSTWWCIHFFLFLKWHSVCFSLFFLGFFCFVFFLFVFFFFFFFFLGWGWGGGAHYRIIENTYNGHWYLPLDFSAISFHVFLLIHLNIVRNWIIRAQNLKPINKCNLSNKARMGEAVANSPSHLMAV